MKTVEVLDYRGWFTNGNPVVSMCIPKGKRGNYAASILHEVLKKYSAIDCIQISQYADEKISLLIKSSLVHLADADGNRKSFSKIYEAIFEAMPHKFNKKSMVVDFLCDNVENIIIKE